MTNIDRSKNVTRSRDETGSRQDLESIYEEALYQELVQRGIPVKR